MVYGTIEGSFELLTNENSIKWKLPVNSAGTGVAVSSFSAGMIVMMDLTDEYLKKATASQALAGELCGVAMDSYNSTYNDSQGSGFVTVVLGPHVGRTTQVDGFTTASKMGAIVYPSATTGKFGVTAGSAKKVGNLLQYDGTWLTYYWSGLQL